MWVECIAYIRFGAYICKTLLRETIGGALQVGHVRRERLMTITLRMDNIRVFFQRDKDFDDDSITFVATIGNEVSTLAGFISPVRSGQTIDLSTVPATQIDEDNPAGKSVPRWEFTFGDLPAVTTPNIVCTVTNAKSSHADSKQLAASILTDITSAAVALSTGLYLRA
jgi:hypothetical protein